MNNWFADDAYKIEQVEFADGTVWNTAYLLALSNATDGNDLLFGTFTDNVILGLGGNDELYGYDGNDTLDSGTGNDLLVGETGNDVYLFNLGGGQDTIENYDENTGNVDTIHFGDGIAANDIRFARNGDHLVLSIDGSSDQLTIQSYFENDGDSAYQLEQIRFADGTIADIATIKAYLLHGDSSDQMLTGYASDDIIAASGGTDIVYGMAGNDTIDGAEGNDLLHGGIGDDVLYGGIGNDLIIRGAGNDSIYTDIGKDILAFNRGDGQDAIDASTGNDNTLSLGNGITYADLVFNKTGNDLILATGVSDQITFKDWYASVNNHGIANLQMVIEGTADYNAASTNQLNNKKVQQFNFDGLVAAFDQATTADPALTSWALSSSLLNFYLNSSDTAAIGGDLAYQYGRNGNLTSMSMIPAQVLLASPQFGTGNQNLQAANALQDVSPRLL